MKDDRGLRLQLFGGPRVHGPAGPVKLSPNQLAFLSIVFVEGPLTRPRVAEILWRDAERPEVRQRIRQLLHTTNQRLGLDGVVAEGDVLAPGPLLSCDLTQWREALSSGRLRDAASIGLSGFAPLRLPNVAGVFLDWVEEVDVRLERSLREAAVVKWEETSHSRTWQEARDAAECLYLMHPDDPAVIERVVEARARVGRLGSAEAAYATYVESLAPGAAPEAGVARMIQRVRALRAEQGGRRPSTAPFVGREEALAAGRAALERVGSGEFSVLMVSGESGIGKTRLLEELTRDAVLAGFRCLSASPVELERRIPLNPLLDALRAIDLRPHLEALGRPWSAVVSSLLPAGLYDELVEELPPIRESSLPRRLLDAFSLLLERLALERPTVLFLDDLQWADATTVAALQFFQRRWTKGAFGIVASVRPELVAPTDPASKYLSGADGIEVQRVALGDLSDDEAHRLIDAVSEGTVTGSVAERLCTLAGPHPLYLTELTRDFMSGRLRLPDLPADEVTIPVSLQQILEARIRTLSKAAVRLAGVLAVGGRPMRLGHVAALCGIGLDECTDRVEELEQGRLVEVSRDTVKVSHELFRSALYNHLSGTRRAILHRRHAEHLLEDSPKASFSELAIHFARAGKSDSAAHYGWKAAARAWRSGAMAEAAYFYELVAENESDPARRAEATADGATSLHMYRDLTRANPALELAASRLREVGNTRRAQGLDIYRVEGLAATGTVPIPDLLDRLRAIKDEARDSSNWEALARALDAELKLLNRQGNVTGMREVFAQLRVTAEGHSRDVSVLSHAALAMQVIFGDPKAGLASARLAAELAPTDSEDRLKVLNRLIVAFLYQGLVLTPEARQAMDEARALAERSGDRWERFGIEANIALALLDAGEPDLADQMMQRAGVRLGEAEYDIPEFNLANNRAELALARGDFEGAAQYYRAAEASIRPNTPTFARDLVNAGLGLCALETGDLSEARRREQELGEPILDWSCDPTTILTFRARVLERRAKRPQAIALLEESTKALEHHHAFAWLKLGAFLVHLYRKEGRYAEAKARAQQCLARVEALHLPRRAEQFACLIERVDQESSLAQ